MFCDNFFAPVPGASYPNHLFFVAGHSGGVFDNPENTRTVPFPGGGRWKSWGWDAPENAFVLSRGEDGTTSPRPVKRDATGDAFEHPGTDPSWPEQFRTVRERSFRFRSPIRTQS